jgi:hypothetical protein
VPRAFAFVVNDKPVTLAASSTRCSSALSLSIWSSIICRKLSGGSKRMFSIDTLISQFPFSTAIRPQSCMWSKTATMNNGLPSLWR